MPLLTAQSSSVKFTGYEGVTNGKENSRKNEKNEEATLNPELIFSMA